MLAAVREPARFARLIHAGPSPYYLSVLPGYAGGFERDDLLGLMEMMQKNYRGWAGALAPVIVGNPDRAEHAAELEASFCATDPVWRIALPKRHFCRTTGVRCPTCPCHR